MPLPSHAFALSGGCNCRALTYRIAVPPLSERPLHPSFDSSSDQDPVHLPYTFTDHCNDCRRATGSVLPAWITTPVDTVTCVVTSPSSRNKDANGDIEKSKKNAEDNNQVSARNVFLDRDPSTESAEVLSFYESSPGIQRAFCKICGTNLAWINVRDAINDFDIWYGTLDKEWLDTEEAVPERHCMWGLGLGWMKRWCDSGDGGELERHERDDMSQYRYKPGRGGKLEL